MDPGTTKWTLEQLVLPLYSLSDKLGIYQGVVESAVPLVTYTSRVVRRVSGPVEPVFEYPGNPR